MSQASVDWDKPKRDFYRILGGIAMKALTANGFHAEYVETREDAVREVLSLVPEGASVGVPGSVTVRELGLIERLEESEVVPILWTEKPAFLVRWPQRMDEFVMMPVVP